ncbi:dihydrofolate reductase family protein [Companilactobacillus versmoldensis]|nr:dihydrofolate reductase family protein [Companilactobacillus versmoldensis]
MARQVILFVAQSLDGYIAKLNGSVDFLNQQTAHGVDIDREYDKLTEHVDTVVMGRKTYSQVVNQLSPEIYPYVDFQNYIMTSKPAPSTENLHFVSGSVDQLVEKLKKQTGKDIWIIGGSSIITPLVNANLIDVYQIGVVPEILGEGIPLFPHEVKTHHLELISAEKINQVAYLTYHRLHE